MKRVFNFLMLTILVLGSVAFSCEADLEPETEPETPEQPEDPNKPDDPQPEEPQPEEPTGPKPGLYKFVASPLKGSWQPGDQIYVHGNLGTQTETITLAAADISEDGTTATGTLGAVTESPAEPDGLYAAWPAEAVKPYKGILKAKTTFLECERLLTMAYLEGDTFTFSDISSSFSFTVSGDYNQYAIMQNNWNSLNYSKMEVEFSSTRVKHTPTGDAEPFRTGTLESGQPVHVWMPGRMSVSGLTIYVGKDGEWPMVCTLDEKLSLHAGQNSDLGDITALLQPNTEPVGPKARELMGERTRYKVKFNELSGLCMSADENFLWTVGDNGEIAQLDFEGKLINRVVLRWGERNGSESKGTQGGYDTEGVTVNPLTGDLIVSMEQNYVGVISFEDQATLFQQDTAFNVINTIFRIPDAENYGNSGTEGITYYKDGKVYVGAQDGPAHLFLYDLDTKKELVNVRLGNKFPSMSEIAGLCYDPLTDWLWVIDSNTPQKMFALTGDASKIVGVFVLEDTDNPESICIDHKNGCIWAGDDAGSSSYVYKYPFTWPEEAYIKQE